MFSIRGFGLTPYFGEKVKFSRATWEKFPFVFWPVLNLNSSIHEKSIQNLCISAYYLGIYGIIDFFLKILRFVNKKRWWNVSTLSSSISPVPFFLFPWIKFEKLPDFKLDGNKREKIKRWKYQRFSGFCLKIQNNWTKNYF